ncbi:MAG: ATP-dependent helicase [Chitinophagaceae bacterium]|nr:ATP-dependent helicase [Chitinophagaceae bacterium]
MKSYAYNKSFQEAYDRLNPEQQRAVNQLEGPVMVIAGPGTGKTQILSARIGKILMETDAAPENILCLTYTDAGVIAMRRRLLSFIGPDAYKVNIHTFHAFCNDIIQENLSLFEKTSLDPVSDLERITYFKQLIDSFPKNHPLKRYRGDVYFEIGNLHALFSTMKREGWSPEFINTRIDEYISSLPQREEFVYKTSRPGKWSKGELKPAYSEAIDKMEKLRAAVNEFNNFQKIMRQKNRYDFDDMINWVIKAFEDDAGLLAGYQEKYQYILVDEYQDTSGTQNRLIQLLISYWDAPNIFVVGDDDQSIYRFQGANVENMLAFAESYKKDLLTVVLTNNYRSTQPILDISKLLISGNEERLIKQIDGLSKDLISSNNLIRHLEHRPVIRQYETQSQEMIGIALEVENLLSLNVAPGKIGVIYKENKFGEELARYFTLRSIPHFSKRSQNILEIPIAKKIILLLKYVAAEHDIPYGGDEMLFEILHFDWFAIPPIEIARISIEVAGKRQGGTKTSIREVLYEKIISPPRDLFSKSIHEGLRKAGNALESLIADAPNITLQQLFENIIRKAGVISFIMQSPDKIWLLQVITGLFDFIKEETRRNPFLNPEQLINTIELMEKEDLKLPLAQISGSDQGVNLLTAHGSKGLEFEYVFFAGANSAFWEKKRKPGGGFSFPDTIFTSPPKAAADEELRRLFYVALTRAEQYLTISFSRHKNDGKEMEPSMFIAEIQALETIPVEKANVKEEIIAFFNALQFNEAKAPEIDKLDADFVDRALEKFSMNVTALNNYLKCPLDFYFKNLIRIPSPKNEAAEFGSAVHAALEQLFRKMQLAGRFPSRQEFISDFESHMHRHRESFTREQFARRMEYGPEILANYYDNYISTFNTVVAIERNIQNVVNGIPLKGKLDKLEFDGKNVNVVDYKTGDPDKAKSKLQPPDNKEPHGGDYWRQAVFYKILLDNYQQKDWKVVSTEFDFIEPDKKKNYRRERLLITLQDITTVAHQINDVWQKIQNRDFYTGCGKEDCHWCNFVKDNKLAVALHDMEQDD